MEKAGLPELWKPFVTGELEVVVVPGKHVTMVNEPMCAASPPPSGSP